VGFWLTWADSILALISTAGIFPDFISSGSIDLFLARPIGRLRLFLTKYVAGLMFVTLQVSIFTVISFLVLGIRGRLWEPGLLYAIPLVVIFFSYLFSICTLVGVLLRSTVAALLLTILAWAGIWMLDYTDRMLQVLPEQLMMQRDIMQDQIDATDRRLEQRRQEPGASTQPGIAALEKERAELVAQRDAMDSPQWLFTARNVVYGVKSFVPKTRETIAMLDRVLFEDEDLREHSRHDEVEAPTAEEARRRRMRRGGDLTNQVRLDRERSGWWVIGTSLLFEVGMLALGAWIFCRRDY
jgi:hypothetical protein